jgi:hypothetical protein
MSSTFFDRCHQLFWPISSTFLTNDVNFFDQFRQLFLTNGVNFFDQCRQLFWPISSTFMTNDVNFFDQFRQLFLTNWRCHSGRCGVPGFNLQNEWRPNQLLCSSQRTSQGDRMRSRKKIAQNDPIFFVKISTQNFTVRKVHQFFCYFCNVRKNCPKLTIAQRRKFA